MMARRILFTTAILLVAQVGLAGEREEARVLEATQVLEDTQAMPDQRMPDWLLQRAQGIAVMPSVIKGALIFGGRGGNNVGFRVALVPSGQ